MDIVIIANFCGQFNDTDNNRFFYLAGLLSSNCTVEIITSDFNHTIKDYFDIKEHKEPFEITMLHESIYKKNICLSRFKAHYIWGRNVSKYLKSRKKPDIVYCAVPTLKASYEAAKYCEKNNVRFIIDIQDLWPEAFQMVFNIPVISKIFFFPFKCIANRIYKKSDEIVAVSKEFLKRGLSVNRNANGLVVYLGTEKKIFDSIPKNNIILSKKNVLVYIGTLGRSYDISNILKAISISKHKDNIHLLIMGDGPLYEKFREEAKFLNIDCEFTGLLPYKKMVGRLKSCDIALNPIVKGSAGSIINKVNDYAMAGLPIINTQECQEYRELLDMYNAGINCECESVNSIKDAIDLLISNDKIRLKMGDNSRKIGELFFDRNINYKKIIDKIEEVSNRE